MARPSVITDKQWKDIEARVLNGESMRAIAREYNVSEGVIRKRINTQTKPVKEIANQLARAELALEALPINTQVKVRSLADELKDISHHIASAARYGAMTAHRLAGMANSQLDMIDETDPFTSVDAMKSVNALTSMANEAGKTAIQLLNTNKEQVQRISEPEEKEVMSLDDFYKNVDKPNT